MTIETKSQAEQDVLAAAQTPETLECATCGRDCRHVAATAGGGTAGGVKGQKWTETERSKVRCPSCGQKPHRKEGRAHQRSMCFLAQIGLKLGLTTFPDPAAPITWDTGNNMVLAGQFREPPTEKQMHKILGGMDPVEAMKPEAPRLRKNQDVSVQVPKQAPGEIAENMTVVDGGFDLPELPEITSNMKKRRTAEEIETSKLAHKQEVEDRKKARDEAREKKKADDKAEKAAARAAKAAAKAAAGTKAAEDEIVVPEGAHDTVEPEELDISDYLPNLNDDDEEDDELTPEQRAALTAI